MEYCTAKPMSGFAYGGTLSLVDMDRYIQIGLSSL